LNILLEAEIESIQKFKERNYGEKSYKVKNESLEV